jgi:hypothetical protein
MLPIDAIRHILSFVENPSIKARTIKPVHGGESTVFVNQIGYNDYRYNIIRNIPSYGSVNIKYMNLKILRRTEMFRKNSQNFYSHRVPKPYE